MKTEKIKRSVLKSIKLTLALIRVFPYAQYFLPLFPFFAVLFVNGKITSIDILLFILSIVFAMAAGFVYNTICDAEQDPKEKNPITAGNISRDRAYFILLTSVAAAFLFFSSISRSTVAVLLFGVYLLIWLAYSGLGARFKETILGPIVASIVLWSGPSALLLSSFTYSTLSATMLLVGVFIAFTGLEIAHTITDFDLDFAYGCRTFTVILGKKRASVAEFVALALGLTFIFAAIFIAVSSDTFIVLLIGTFLVTIASIAFYNPIFFVDLEGNITFRGNSVVSNLAYIVIRVLITAYALIVLGLSPILVFLVLWIWSVSFQKER